MDVTLSNFKDVLPEIYEAIDDCDFMAIDTEFTGLSDGPEARVTAFDTPEGYYLKLKNCTSEFLLVQVGLCLFKYDEARNKYSHRAFNFYVFPRTIGRFGNDVKFLCQSSSIHFLSDSGFDFNKLFKEGIPYLNSASEKVLLEELVMKYENLSESDTFSKVSIPDNLKSTIEHACTRIEKFLSPDNEETEIIFEKCNAFVRKLIFQEWRKLNSRIYGFSCIFSVEAYQRFSSNNFNLSTKSINNNLVLVAQKGKSKAEMEKENFERDKNEILEAVGFSKVIRRIADSKKLIVGHNMFLDVCHIVNRFCKPLPDNYDEFKETVHGLFPRIVDTKYICSADPFTPLIKSSIIEHLIETLKKSPFNFTDTEPSSPEFAYSIDQKKEHEAGFDAYLTGLVFISLGSYLLPPDSQKNMIHDPQVLREFENKIFIMRILDYSYFDLVKKEPKPDRNHVFHITFPEQWRTKTIVQLFQPYGDVMITWCNRTSAWVSLYKPELAKTVIKKLVHARRQKLSGKRPPYTLVTWEEFANNSSSPTSEPSPSGGALSNDYPKRKEIFVYAMAVISMFLTPGQPVLPMVVFSVGFLWLHFTSKVGYSVFHYFRN